MAKVYIVECKISDITGFVPVGIYFDKKEAKAFIEGAKRDESRQYRLKRVKKRK